MVPSVQDLFGQQQDAFQQDNDPKHTMKATKACVADWPFAALESSGQSPSLNAFRNLRQVLGQHCQVTTHGRNAASLLPEC